MRAINKDGGREIKDREGNIRTKRGLENNREKEKEEKKEKGFKNR